MNGGIDVIEVLRQVNPVPLNTVDERTCPTANELRAALRRSSPPVPVRLADDAQTDPRPKWPRYVAAAIAAAVGVVTFGVLRLRDSTDPAPTTDLRSLFVGTWTSTDADGSTQTMEIVLARADRHEVVVRDDVTIACDGAPATITGTGRLEADGTLVIAQAMLTCDDGTTPVIGPPPQAELANFTFVRGTDDELVDSFGVVWRREGADEPSPPPTASGTMWPQSNSDELSEAQELAVAGDPAYTWQIEPQLTGNYWWEHLVQSDPEIVGRFLREELGWEEYLFHPNLGADGDGMLDRVLRGLVYLRCKPGETNPLYPIGSERMDARGGERCAPTIDELHYETVSLDLTQPARRGSTGIWVVSRWTTIAPFAQTRPLSSAEVTDLLDAFLQRRVDGHGAEEYVHGHSLEIPLLYATTSGSPFERFEHEIATAPQWPAGQIGVKVRLFADGDTTVVEQFLAVNRAGDQWGLEYYEGRLESAPTTENGQPLAVPYTFLDGDVTLAAPWPWTWSPFENSPDMDILADRMDLGGGRRITLVADPRPVLKGCAQGRAPADAVALARRIRSDPDLEVTSPVATSVTGVSGVQMDVVLRPDASVCAAFGSPQVLSPNDRDFSGVGLEHGERMRLVLLDLPDGLVTRMLAIAIVAPDERFDEMVATVQPILESIEFDTP